MKNLLAKSNNYLNEIYIDIGKCEVIKNIPCKIKIVLGSCIGVILADTELKVVGGIHILLPNYKKYKLEDKNITAYADTGIIHLIKIMKEYGCKESNIKAIIAGGSSIGGTDYFDIGMQNYITTKNILNKLNIKILHENCLGDKPRVLIFYTDNFKFNILTLGDNKQYEEDDFSSIDYSKFLNEINEIKFELQPRVNKLIKLIKLQKEDTDLNQLETIIKSDDFLALKIIKHVNTSYYSPKTRITNIKLALSYLGIKNFFKFIYSELMNSISVDELKFYSIDSRGYKIHAFTVALLSEYIAEYSDCNPDELFLAGLFHDIGKIFIDKYSGLKYNVSDRAKVLKFVENSIKNTLHAKIGGDFLKKINIPDIICEAVYNHHTPQYTSPEFRRFVSIIAFSNSIVSNYILGSNIYISKLPFNSSSDIVENLGIDFNTLETIISQIGYFFSIAEELVDD
ncbi:HDOD domain-containing protein [Deferribacter abyssi]|uniref:HDOD domain-containing protein n=1 Tax=Deferribacter abyssi TaxID=213806 RepID=UPI003C1D77A0